ncbi:MAG: hypothetical protein M3R70_01500 [Actinomycetota bacterium]|nr:hypothetical protein [Actinomycetota bacterium]
MRKTVRLVGLACAGASALAFAGSALAVPKIEIFQSSYALGGSAPLDLTIQQEETDAAPAKNQILVPLGYQVNLAQPVGATVGEVTEASASAVVAGTKLRLPLSGPIKVVNQAPYATASTRCTGRPTHQAIWTLELTVKAVNQTLLVPMYVDAAGPAGIAATLQVCLPSPYIPESSGGARFGAKLLKAVLRLDGVLTAPADANDYVWHLITTPYVVGSGTPNAPQTVESRAVVPYPYRLTLKRAKSKNPKVVKLTGRLTDATGALPGVRPLLQDVTKPKTPKSLGRTGKTNTKGNFTKTLRATRAARFLQAVFGPLDVTSSACTAPVMAPAGCVSATQSAVKSNRVKVPGYRPKKKKK